jgi:hypothetical protein
MPRLETQQFIADRINALSPRELKIYENRICAARHTGRGCRY